MTAADSVGAEAERWSMIGRVETPVPRAPAADLRQLRDKKLELPAHSPALLVRRDPGATRCGRGLLTPGGL